MEIKWLLEHSSDVKNVVVAVLAQETADDVTELKSAIRKGVEVVFDILREPLHEAGIDIDGSRGLISREAELVRAKLEALQNKDEE